MRERKKDCSVLLIFVDGIDMYICSCPFVEMFCGGGDRIKICIYHT